MSCQSFFIAGTDTGVGKTLVAVALTRACVARGLRTAVMKPVAAGVIRTPAGARNDDALALAAASNVPASYDEVNPWLLTTPASPHLAARADGVTIRHEPILAAYRKLAATAEVMFVEGAGGWHAPISASETMADVAEQLALPVILVVGMRLGCLNHALLTRDAIRARGMRCAGWIANLLETEMPLAAENIATLENWFGVAPLALVPSATAMGTDLKSVPSHVAARATGTDLKSVPFHVPSWAIEAAKNLLSH